MSIRARDAAANHTWIRGTMVSTDALAPSILNRAFLETVGMPNVRGLVHVDGKILRVSWQGPNQETVAVYCVETGPTPNECVLL